MINDVEQKLREQSVFYQGITNPESYSDSLSLMSSDGNWEYKLINEKEFVFSLFPKSQIENDNEQSGNEDYNQRYYIYKKGAKIDNNKIPKKNQESSTNNKEQNIEKKANKINIFKVFRVDDSNANTGDDNKYRGKKRNRNKNGRVHDKNGPDNMLRKIQVSYINFIFTFSNFLISKYFNRKDTKILKFLKIGYDFKKVVNKKNVAKLKSKTINEIILMSDISTKYKKYDSYNNKIVLEEVSKNCEVLKKLFQKNYLFLFNVYYQKERKLNLDIIGLQNENIELPNNIKLFEDIFRKKNNDNKKYRDNMEQTVKNFLLDL